MVAMAYAARHPSHPAKLVLISTEAVGGSYLEKRVELFERFGRPEVGALARRRFLESKGEPDEAAVAEWRRLAMPHYTRKPLDPNVMRRAIIRPDVLQWWAGSESRNFDMLAHLSGIACPTL